MPKIHPKPDVVRQLQVWPEARQKVLRHVRGCPPCRALLALESRSVARPPGDRRVLAWRDPAPDYGRVIDKVFLSLRPKISAAEQERDEAPALLAELLRHPPGRREVLVRNSLRFRRLGLCARLLAASCGEVARQPPLGEDLARLALCLADLLVPEEHESRYLDDLRARGWVLIATARRAVADLEGAEQAFARAEEHLRRGTRELAERADLLVQKAALRRAQRRFPEAIRLLRRATSIWLAAGERQRVAESLQIWALVSELAGEPEEAALLLTQARRMRRQAETPREAGGLGQ